MERVMRTLSRGVVSAALATLAACGVNAFREDPDAFRREMNEHRGMSSAIHINSFSVPRSFDAVMNDIKPTAERCLTYYRPGTPTIKIPSSSRSAVVSVKSPDKGILVYWADGLIFLLADFDAEAGSTKITITRSHGFSGVESDIRLWASGQSRECKLHVEVPFVD
jgi:hypothetical protein